jgi:hypothetical protein
MSPRKKPNLRKIKQSESGRWLLFSLWFCASFVLFLRTLIDVFRFAAHNEDVSHMFLIPVVSVGLIYFRRQSIFQQLFYNTVLGPTLALIGLAVAHGPAERACFDAPETHRCTCVTLAHGRQSFTVRITDDFMRQTLS